MSESIVTIQQTSKKWKAASAIGTALLILGISLLMIGGMVASPGAIIVGAVASLAGVCVAIYAKVGTWWHHK